MECTILITRCSSGSGRAGEGATVSVIGAARRSRNWRRRCRAYRATRADRYFASRWEARVFAITLALYQRGVFTWPEWAAALPEEI
jgi:hypothetical protein